MDNNHKPDFSSKCLKCDELRIMPGNCIICSFSGFIEINHMVSKKREKVVGLRNVRYVCL